MEQLFSQYTTEQLSRLLMTMVTNESGEAGVSTKAIMEELERRTKSK
jgi:hypothetical protein